MALELIWHGHACFTIKGGGAILLLDPFFTDNPKADLAADEVEADYILVSHAHGDHFGDTLSIAKRTGAVVISNAEIASYCREKGVEAHGLNLGGGHPFPFGRVKMTIAHHGSLFPEGTPGGNPGGFLIDLEGKRIYFAGDTGLFYDMRLIGEEKAIDIALLPIGDNYTMGPDDALRAVQLLSPQVVIPMHYSTWPVIEQDPMAFAARMEGMGVKCVVLAPGESLAV